MKTVAITVAIIEYEISRNRTYSQIISDVNASLMGCIYPNELKFSKWD